ncbi:MAG: GNAT family N-acetyltransferase [Cocleimonas sp.]|nr:GNAT family N-acetyltransferase [Cocleimonas sp.]
MKLYYRDTFPATYPEKDKTSKTPPTLLKNDYRIDIIQNKNDFFQLKTQWNDLVSISQDPNPFLLWEWMYTWWETYSSKQDELFIIALYDTHNNDQFISLAPFYIKHCYGFISRLSFLGEGENDEDAAVTHYPDIIINKVHRDNAIQIVSEYLASKKHLFHYASFDFLKSNAVLQQLNTPLSNDFSIQSKQNAYQFLTPLPNNADDYVASLSKSARKQFRLKHNRMSKLGDIKTNSEENLHDGLCIAEQLHRSRWSHISEQNVFDSETFSKFHQKLCKRFANQNIMDFRTLRINGKPTVIAYNFNYQETCYSYLSGFESEDDKRLSPMFIFDILEIKSLIKQKYHAIDFLVSEEKNSYKAKYGGDILPIYQTRWFSNCLISQMLKAFFIMKPYLSKVYHKIKLK